MKKIYCDKGKYTLSFFVPAPHAIRWLMESGISYPVAQWIYRRAKVEKVHGFSVKTFPCKVV